MRNGEAFFAPPEGTAVSLGAATFVMSGGNPDVGWTVLRTDDGYDLTRFDGKTGALGATYKSARRTRGRGARRVGGRPARHVHAFQ